MLILSQQWGKVRNSSFSHLFPATLSIGKVLEADLGGGRGRFTINFGSIARIGLGLDWKRT